ncbi:sulfatase [Haloferula sp. A504]|uniref:sulfatase n=1 Tax=Haloferula sp. A504 TaxID=3373601 RepID=UPI0031BEB7E4|nr:sulfatase [Verrucomicrobiaceae bacterium E54]
MKTIIALGAALLVQAEELPPADSAKAGPNVLLLISDDLNSWLLENPDRYTGKVIAPNLRKLADGGVNFSFAYTAAPVCSPSRTAFLSGVAPWRSGHYHNALKVGDSGPLNNDEVLSLPGLFKKAGYATFGYGKISHGWDQKEHWDEKIGHKRDPAPPGAPITPVGGGEQDWAPIHLAEEKMNDTLNANHAIKAIEQEHDKPFFIACGLFNPHMPWYVPQKYFDMYPLSEIVTPVLKEDDLADVPPLGRALTNGKSGFATKVVESGLHKEAVQAYLATTTYADAQLGRVLDALETSPHKDNTIVVFLSDHGFHLAEKDHWQKATLWEEATHCLLTIRAPGVTKPGGISHRFVSLMDIYPTLAELCDLEPPPYLDGRSLVPLLKDPDADWQSTAITGLCDKSRPTEPYLSIRTERGRYIRYGTEEEEFYDTTKDPHEWTNQIDNPEYASVIGVLRAALPADPAKPLKSALADRRGREKKPKKNKRDD